VSLDAGCLVFLLFTTFLLYSYTPRFYHPPYLFHFDKFSSFLRGTFGVPHLVIKKRKERNNKGKSKGTVQNHKQTKRKRRKVKEGNQKLARPISLPSFFLASSTSIFGVPKLSNSAPLIYGKQNHPILCAIFSSQRFGAPSPPLHAYLPRPTCLFLFGFTWFPQHSLRVCTLIQLYIC
jgi:hypothetical protein